MKEKCEIDLYEPGEWNWVKKKKKKSEASAVTLPHDEKG